MAPKMSTPDSLEPINMLCYLAKGTLKWSKDFTTRRWCWVAQVGGPNVFTRTLRSEGGSRRVGQSNVAMEEEAGEFQSIRVMCWPTVLGFEDGGRRLHEQEMHVAGVSKLRMALSCQPAGKWGSQSFSCKGLNSANGLKEQGHGFSPKSLQKGMQPCRDPH